MADWAMVSQASSQLRQALSACKSAFVGIGILSGILNILALTGSLFMLEIYDRVLPSRSIPTLVGLTILVSVLYIFFGLLDLIRGRVLIRVGSALDEALSEGIFRIIALLPLKVRSQGDGLQPLRDLDQIRSFLSGLGPAAMFDLPWIPLYLAICFAFHFWIGMTALVGALLLVITTLVANAAIARPGKAGANLASDRISLAQSARRNAEVIHALGMTARLTNLWGTTNTDYRDNLRRGADLGVDYAAISKVVRMMLQSLVLGVGAFLVIRQEATAGIIIASSILTSRALAPVELAIAHWRGFLAARQSWGRLETLFSRLPAGAKPLPLPRPTASLSVESVSAVPPGGQKAVVHNVSFTLAAGQGLGVIGRSASGKSSLARMLVGVWAPARGQIRLDGAALDHWDPLALGAFVGYLPQDVELFAGTVAQNICRFEAELDARAIIAAAKAAGIHEMILGLPNAYETQVGENGSALSAGQQQRIALARALYKDPFLLVLDEPNSNLDSDGDRALTNAILAVRARGGIVVVIAHRSSALAGVDLVLVMVDGQAQAFGPKDEIFAKVLVQAAAGDAAPRPAVASVTPLRDVSGKSF
jgi:PrtD family type I secretion system ABC transporter